MRILLLAPQPFYSERGTPIAIRLAATALCDAGHSVDILTYHEGEDVRIENLRVLRIRKPPGVTGVPIGFSWKKIICDVWLSVAAFRRLRRVRYDVVHAVEESVFPALLARRLFGFQLVYDMDSIMTDQLLEKWPVLRIARTPLASFEKTAVLRADLVLAVCPAIADYARAFGRAEHVHVLPDVAFPARDSGVPDGPAEPLRPLFPVSGPLAVYVGNLERYQGVDLLLAGLAAVPEAKRCNLAIVGGTPRAQSRYLALARSLRIENRVRFTGPLPLARLPDVLAQADILCSPRLSGTNTPMKIYSYLASGRAILATAIVSHTQVLDERSACLVPPEPHAFGSGLARLAGDPELRQRLGEHAARIGRDEYSLAAYSRRLLGAYRVLETAARSRVR
jgi:glycosyltransferase involved in cell wall biosynthesis